MPVHLQVPVRVGREPVVLVSVEDDRGLVADPALAEDALEGLLVDDVALDRILEVFAPVELDRSGDVAFLVEVGVLVDLGDDEIGVAEVLGKPVRRHEDGVRVSVLRHAEPPTMMFAREHITSQSEAIVRRRRLLDELLGDQAQRGKPHGRQNAEERSERTEGRTLFHVEENLGSRAGDFDKGSRHPSRPSKEIGRSRGTRAARTAKGQSAPEQPPARLGSLPWGTGQCRRASGRRSGRNRPAVRGTRPAWSASGEPSPSQSSPPSRSGSPGAFPRRGGTVVPPAGRRPAAPQGRPEPSRRRHVG